jgi:hypothetical protein
MLRRRNAGLFAKIEDGFSGRMPQTVLCFTCPKSPEAIENQYLFPTSRSAAPIIGASPPHLDIGHWALDIGYSFLLLVTDFAFYTPFIGCLAYQS